VKLNMVANFEANNEKPLSELVHFLGKNTTSKSSRLMLVTLASGSVKGILQLFFEISQ